MNVADECRKMGLKVGDTIFGREDTCGHWHEAKLTLLWLGKEIAIWSETTRSSRNTEWSKPCETGSWSLLWREWKKVETDEERQP